MSISPSSGAKRLQRLTIPIPVHYISKMANVYAPSSTLRKDRGTRPVSFL